MSSTLTSTIASEMTPIGYARLAGLHHRDEQRREGPRELLDGRRERIALRDVEADVADDDPKARVLGLVLEGLEALHERQAGDEERRQLLREHGQLAERQLVFLGALLERLLLGQGLRRANVRAGLLRPFKSWCVAGRGRG
jgi:hypothetical protein